MQNLFFISKIINFEAIYQMMWKSAIFRTFLILILTICEGIVLNDWEGQRREISFIPFHLWKTFIHFPRTREKGEFRQVPRFIQPYKMSEIQSANHVMNFHSSNYQNNLPLKLTKLNSKGIIVFEGNINFHLLYPSLTLVNIAGVAEEYAVYYCY